MHNWTKNIGTCILAAEISNVVLSTRAKLPKISYEEPVQVMANLL